MQAQKPARKPLQPAAQKTQGKPNILVIWGDDIGLWNVSAYNLGQMGYKTPNIDRIAREGALFTDLYGQQSCTAGRGAFLTGQSPFRTGLLKVGLPGAKEGLQPEDPTIAEMLKPLGYVTGQFGKNHLGDLDAMLPTMHGFDEFFGSLYHLNAEEEPENPDYPKDPAFRAKYAPRGVLHSWALPDGGQKIENTGPLTKKRMETIDEEFEAAAVKFIRQSNKDGKPFFVWFNSTRMHIWTHLQPSSEGKTGLGIYPDGMVEHDALVGRLLGLLDSLGIAENTIVMYSTDNGAEKFSWPDGGTSPYRNEKASNWEGAYRVPGMIKWPGVDPARHGAQRHRLARGLASHARCGGRQPERHRAAAQRHDGREQVLQGAPRRIQPDGLPQRERPRIRARSSSTSTTTGRWSGCATISGRSYSRSSGLTDWMCGRTPLFRSGSRSSSTSAPIRSRRRTTRASATASGASNTPSCWCRHRPIVAQFLGTFKAYPPRQKAGSFSVDNALDALLNANQQNN